MEQKSNVSMTLIIPSLNPDATLVGVVEGMVAAGFGDIVVVNDGSDSAHLDPFRALEAFPQVTLLTHEVNRGKGAALKTAFRYILDNRPLSLGVVTADGDGQHMPADAYACGMSMLNEGDTVILGARMFDNKNMPSRNRAGNTITRFVFRYLCGIHITDTQTGLRAIPRVWLEDFLIIDGDRFEYETNMLLEFKTRGIPYREQVIETVYSEKSYSTHFNPLTDSIRVYKPILKFTAGSMMSTLVDLGLFTLFNLAVLFRLNAESRILASTVLARVISSAVNYLYNRGAVFKSKDKVRSTVWRYYILCLFQMGASYGLVYLFDHLTGASGVAETLIKFIVDAVLFFVSFQIQREWVFGRRVNGNERKDG